MSTKLKDSQQERELRRAVALSKALDFELAGSLEAAGTMLLGFSAKWDGWDCLITLRAVQGADRVVAFVGSDSLPNCLLKCVRDAQNDCLRWKKDGYAK